MASCFLHFTSNETIHGVEYEVTPMGIRLIRVTTLDGAVVGFNPAVWVDALNTISKFIDPSSDWDDGYDLDALNAACDEDDDEDAGEGDYV